MCRKPQLSAGVGGPDWQTHHVDALPAWTPPSRRSLKAKFSKVVVIAALLACFAGMGWAFTLNKTPELPGGTEIEGVEPVYGAAAVPGQTPVKVDLRVGYRGQITLLDSQQKAIPLPDDEVTYEPAQAILTFTPGPGKAVTRFDKGLYTAQVVYWPLANPSDRKIFQWSFTVV